MHGSCSRQIPIVSSRVGKNFLADNWDHDQAVRRGRDYQFVSLDEQVAEAFYDASSAPDSTAERLFELGWAKSLTAGALDSLRQELQAEGKGQLFEELRTFLTGGSVLPSYGVFDGNVDVSKTLIVGVDVVLRNGDCAEEFDASAAGIDPGTVVVLDDNGTVLDVHGNAVCVRLAGRSF